MTQLRCLFLAAFLAAWAIPVHAADANRLAYLDTNDPYYVHRTFPKLTTPMWVGEEGVEAVVVLAIDDMRGHEKWETFLRPILERLKRIDGRAPVSIMTCQIDPKQEHLQKWLKEGLSLETHTFDHPCPLLRDSDFAKAKATYDKAVDLLHEVPNSKPVAFRVPCCDSLNTPSPRFYAEIFNKSTPKGNFLTIDSSVFNLFTANDPDLPRELVLEPDGSERFRKYLPRDRTFVNTIEDYPYPYVIGGKCWEFPCVVPSDWSAQHFHKPNNPITVRDWKAALDCTVIKKGVFCLVFHPHGWIKADQIIDLIDHAESKYGKKVKFLTFREAQERLDKNLLGGHPLRDPKTGLGNGVRLKDAYGDGSLVVFIDNKASRQVRTWKADDSAWQTTDLRDAPSTPFLAPLSEYPIRQRINLGATTTFAVANKKEQAVLVRTNERTAYSRAKFTLPPDARLPELDKDHGLRFVDLDEDGSDDVIFSNEKEYGIYLFADMEKGWSRKIMAGKRGDKGELPMISRNGTNNGFFVHSRSLWWQNEDTNLLKDLVDRRSFNELLVNVEPLPKSPEASLKCLKPRPGFQVELVAAEPLVQDPVAFAWGPDGKFWVVEMGDYPLGVDGKGKFGGKVKYLEDTNNDGRYDKATLFLDELGFPTGVMPWRKGVLVSCAPDVFYAEDTDDDGKADKREVLFTGFYKGNQQHRVNGFEWGLDNWVYLANGDSGGLVKSMKTGTVVGIGGRDLRIKPDEGLLETQAGQTQFGRHRDDWGHWFGNNNTNPMYHFALEDHYLRRNPHVPPPNGRINVSVQPGAAPVFPLSRTLPRFNTPQAINHFTSACSSIVYRDDLFGPHFSDSTFISEPVHNLIHREIIAAKGTTFTSRRAADEETSEFLASSDNWFRPTMIQTGPDGALWVADMYRFVIEHPEWIPKDWQQRLDLRAGHDLGRIYRIFPVDKKPRALPRLDKLDTTGLVAVLDSPNGWQRDTAQMLLVQKEARDSIPLLEKMTAECQRPLGRLHALCTLDGLNALTPDVVKKRLGDEHPGVRRHAIRLSEPFLGKSPEFGLVLMALAKDADPQVRLQLAYSLGSWNDPRAGETLGRLALADSGDPIFMAAILSSITNDNLEPVLMAVLKTGQAAPSGLIENLLRTAEGLGDTKAMAALLKAVGDPNQGQFALWQMAALAGLLDALEQRGTSLEKLEQKGDDVRQAVKTLAALFDAARKLVANDKAPLEERLSAVRLLGRGSERQAEDRQRLAEMLSPNHAEEVQAAAATALGRLREPEAMTLLLRGWKGFTPSLRSVVMEVLLRRDEGVKAVLDAAEKRLVKPFEIDIVRRQQLLQHKDAALRERALTLFRDAVSPDRQKVIAGYGEALTMAGDAKRGAEVFAKHCAACHKLGTVGQPVGPDLASLGDKSPDGLLIAILDPNRAVEARYVNYLATTKTGITFNGVLTSQTGTSITLTSPMGKEQVVLRSDLDELISSGKSAMPEGLEKEIPAAAMADLIAHLRSGEKPPQRKVFANNNPEVVKPSPDGTLLFSAKTCEIFGTTLVLEERYGNLGWWSSEDDHAAWTLEVPRAGKYEVQLDYACHNNSAGNRWLLQVGAERMTGAIVGTGTWEVYKQVKFGDVSLTAGRQRLVFRSAGKPVTPLIDLKAIKLIPLDK